LFLLQYIFQSIFFWAQQNLGGTAPECLPVAAGLEASCSFHVVKHFSEIATRRPYNKLQSQDKE